MMEEQGVPEAPAQGDGRAKVISVIVLGAVVLTFWYMLNMVLLTFIMTFIFYNLLVIVQRRSQGMFHRQLPDRLVVVILYLLFAGFLALVSYAVVPTLVVQLTELGRLFVNFDFNAFAESIGPKLFSVMANIDFNKYVAQFGVLIATEATKIGGFGVNILLGLLLSLLLLLEKEEIKYFGEKLSTSKVAFIYQYFMYFGGSFVHTFGQVMKVQVIIAFINAVASMLLLSLMGFPQILGLSIMIFVLGLIPVAGVVVSLIPLTVIGFNIGGIPKVLGVFVMIMIIHALEAYVLNPKLMSSKTHLPVCFVFIILLVGEHYLGVWGLLIGVPIFMFLMDILGVRYEHPAPAMVRPRIGKKSIK